MKYTIYIKHVVWELLSTKHDLIDAIKVIRRNFNDSDRAEYMIIEDDGKSQFPIIYLQNKQDYYNLLEQYQDQLTNNKKGGKIKVK